MDSSHQCQNCDKKRTWLEQTLYKGQMTAWGTLEIS